MTADQPLSEYLKTCSDREYAEYIISTMCGKNPQEWDTAKKEAIEAIRSRPVPAASGLTSTPSDRRGCLTCFDPDCPVWQTADQTCWKGLSEHNAAIRKDEREKILTFIQINQTRFDFDDPDEFYDFLQLMKSDEGINQLKNMGWIDSPLRQQQEREQG